MKVLVKPTVLFVLFLFVSILTHASGVFEPISTVNANIDNPQEHPVLWVVDWNKLDWRFDKGIDGKPYLFIKSGINSVYLVESVVKAGDCFLIPKGKDTVYFQVTEIVRYFDGGSYGFDGIILTKAPHFEIKNFRVVKND